MKLPSDFAPLQLWGGVECTVNRVGDQYFDQLELSGHASRASDLDLIASLGLRQLRYPVLWDRIELARGQYDWKWSDERLTRLRELGIRPVLGLLHHGSGPRFTSLVDPEFPAQFAHFARRVAERYPWADLYTPINEPLTTARFSGLYGFWYPHGKDDKTFLRAFFNQCRAIVLAMKAIREITPGARLLQTEDLGKVFSTPRLKYQTEFENERRWLTWDTLFGRLDASSLLWKRYPALRTFGDELRFFAENPCPPDLIGINHYLTSSRYLDHRLDRYPAHTHGGNGLDRYADVEAVRVCAANRLQPRHVFHETWKRYGLPIVVTEAHLGSTREEQVRWLKDIWEASLNLRSEGVPMQAVTAWALLGSFNWNSLVTRLDGYYEPGAFCVRGDAPRFTAVGRCLQSMASGNLPDLPFFDQHGWWKKESRLLYRVPSRKLSAVPETAPRVPPKSRPILIIGANGTLGRALARACAARGLSHRLATRQEVDIASAPHVATAVDAIRPWAIVNAAGYVRVDDAETDQERCFRENVTGPVVLAEACAKRGLPLVTFSSDLVFDGNSEQPYRESSFASPLNVYGMSKAEAERRVLELLPNALIIRTSAFFGPWDEHNFASVTLRKILAKENVPAPSDVVISPTYVPHLVHSVLDLLIDGGTGIWHVANSGSVSWADFGKAVAEVFGADASFVKPVSLSSLALRATRPKFSALGSEKSCFLPPWEEALQMLYREFSTKAA